MEDSKVIRSLDVFWSGRIVGRYDLLEDGSELFTYDGNYLESAEAAPISHSLPLRADPYGRRQLRPFFAGLLPEESQRQRIAAYLGLAESDDFSMLEAIGGECAGALEIIPHAHCTPLHGSDGANLRSACRSAGLRERSRHCQGARGKAAGLFGLSDRPGRIDRNHIAKNPPQQ